MDAGEFVRLSPDIYVCGRAGPELMTLFPVTNRQLVELVMGPYAPKFIKEIIPIETGHRWQPEANTQTPWCNRAGPRMGPCTDTVNGSGCINWAQLCGKQKQAAALGYTWYEAQYALPGLLIARGLVDDYVRRGLDPYGAWRCDKCSLH